MKISLYGFIVYLCLLPICANAGQKLIDILAGTWHLNGAASSFGGEMTISNCFDSGCKFNIQSWYDSHICDIAGDLFIRNGFAEYQTTKYVYDNQTDTEHYIPVGIIFEITSQDKLNLHYTNTDSANTFCGMNATAEGVWTKQ